MRPGNQITGAFNFDANSQKLKVDQKLFGWALSKMGVANLVYRL